MDWVALDLLKHRPDMPDEEAAAMVLDCAGGWLSSNDDGKAASTEAVKWARGILKDDPRAEKYYARLGKWLKANGRQVPGDGAQVCRRAAA